ncbi:hypothetical protein ACFV97_25820 [Streptomyces sp. NPDC059913]|uniref:hypothetical protein n=1 Tax=unclassified Streptomyces TaxID=2593676 RepID=UPI003658910E
MNTSTMAVPARPSFRAVPGAGFIASCTVATWVYHGSVFDLPIAHLLVGHEAPRRPGETSETIEIALMGMVDAMGLRPAADPIPAVGPRILMRRDAAVLDYGHPQCHLRLPTPERLWIDHVAVGGAVCLTVGLDPLPPGAGPDAVAAYAARVAVTGRAYMGAISERTC